MGGGTAFVQVLGLVAAPILTRLYGPEDFGVMATFSALAEILALVATLRYDAAVPIAKQDRDAASLLVLACVCVVVFSGVVALALLVLPSSIFHAISPDSRFLSFRWYLILAVLGGGFYSVLTGWTTRQRNFLLLSKSRASQSMSSVTIQVGAGFLGLGVIGLILGAIANMASGLTMLGRQAANNLRALGIHAKEVNLAANGWAFRKYPLFTLPTSLLNLAGRSIPILAISALFGASAAGLYGLGLRVVGMPSALISASVANVFLSRVPEAEKAGRLSVLMEETIARLSAISGYLFVVLVCFGPELFSLVFGPAWEEAGVYVRYLSPWLFLGFVFSPLTTVVLAKSRQARDALWQGPMLAARVLALYLGFRFGGNVETAVLMFGATASVTAAGYFLWILRIGGASLRRTAWRLSLDIGMPLALLGGVRAIYSAAGQPTWLIILAIAGTGLLLKRRMLKAWRMDAVQPG